MSAQSNAVRKQAEPLLAAPVPLRPIEVPLHPSNVIAAAAATPRVPALRVLPLQPVNPMRRFARVPTHAVGVFPEQREYPRASLRLPLRLRGVNGRAEDFPITLVTRDISSSGVYFLCPRRLESETQIE